MKNKKTHIMGIRLTPEKYAQIKALADRRNLPVSWWVRAVLLEYLERGHVNGVRLP
jgi:predicted DNA-binding protein